MAAGQNLGGALRRGGAIVTNQGIVLPRWLMAATYLEASDAARAGEIMYDQLDAFGVLWRYSAVRFSHIGGPCVSDVNAQLDRLDAAGVWGRS